MPQTCSVCRHPQRAEVDALLLESVPLRDIAGRFGLSKSALARHATEHLPRDLVRAREAGEVARADDLLGQLRDLQARTLALLARAEEAADLRAALTAVSQVRANLELLAKLLGELQQDGQATVQVRLVWPGDPP